jgi:hypothetical protein
VIVVAVLILLFIIGAIAGASDDSGSGGNGKVDPNSQDGDCHRAALASASNSVPNFQWNGTGMDVYRSEYAACLELKDMLDGG